VLKLPHAIWAYLLQYLAYDVVLCRRPNKNLKHKSSFSLSEAPSSQRRKRDHLRAVGTQGSKMWSRAVPPTLENLWTFFYLQTTLFNALLTVFKCYIPMFACQFYDHKGDSL